MSRKRKAIPLKTKLAASLLMLGDVPHEDAKRMTTEQILSLYQFDHWPVLHSHDGPDEPWNLVPRMIRPHREKSKIDASVIAKVKRIQRKHGLSASFVAMAEVIDRQMVRPKRKIAQRENPWPKRSLRATRKPNVRQIADGR